MIPRNPLRFFTYRSEDLLPETQTLEAPVQQQPRGRRDSLVLFQSDETNLIYTFEPEGVLSSSEHQVVRTFSSPSFPRRKFIVKHPTPVFLQRFPRMRDASEFVHNEAHNYRSAYPECSPYIPIFFSLPTEDNPEGYSYRLLVPYAHGWTLYGYIKLLTPIDELLYCLLLAAEELARIHRAGVLHGDVHSGNIVFFVGDQVDQMRFGFNPLRVRFIDFGHSYTVSDETATTTKNKCSHWAPERTGLFPRTDGERHIVSPHLAQDVYSFGCLAREILNAALFTMHLRIQPVDESLISLLKVVIAKTVQPNPAERAALSDVINVLDQGLRQYRRQPNTYHETVEQSTDAATHTVQHRMGR